MNSSGASTKQLADRVVLKQSVEMSKRAKKNLRREKVSAIDKQLPRL